MLGWLGRKLYESFTSGMAGMKHIEYQRDTEALVSEALTSNRFKVQKNQAVARNCGRFSFLDVP